MKVSLGIRTEKIKKYMKKKTELNLFFFLCLLQKKTKLNLFFFRGPYRGHYISVVKSHGMWMVFDDDTVERMQPNNMEDFYGVTTDKNSESGYILFYQTRE